MTKPQRHKAAKRIGARSEVFPNSPLAEVVFELRFSGRPAVECRRDEYFESIRRDFPNVWVPNVEVGQPPALQPYQFKSEGDLETVMVSLNRFAYSTKKYGGFADFRPKALTLAGTFCKRFSIRHLNRMGLRYINVIPFVRDAGRIPWPQHFTIQMNLPSEAYNRMTSVSLAYEAKCDAGTITTRIACVRSDQVDEAFLLDFDFAKTAGARAATLSAAIQEAHDQTRRVFDEIVSDQYKAVMRGEVIV